MDIQYAPLRPMEDFLTAGARFQIPDFNKEDRWFNRIVSNLLYYQTNYFLCALGIFFLVGFFHPQEMLAGISTMMIIFGLGMYAVQQKVEIQRFKEQHPALMNVGLFVCAYFLIYQLGCIVVFLLGVMLPIAFVLIHSSLRLRNVKNKLANVSEAFGVSKKSPMSLLLDQLGIEPDLKYL